MRVEFPTGNGDGSSRLGDTEEDPMQHPRKTAIPPNLDGIPSRRDLLRSLASLGLGFGIVGRAEPGAARKRRHKHKKKKRKIRKNLFGCVDVGRACENAGQCCSGICAGKQGKKTCQVHNQGACQAGQDVCKEPPVNNCVTTTGLDGQCTITTGHAGYCGITGVCAPCRRDVDCDPISGPGAACIVCALCPDTLGFACAGITPTLEE